jgi:hypothetical protein
MAAPLELTLTAKKARVLVGEGIVLQVGHKVHADLELETVELNRNRTELTVTGPAGTITLTGADHIALHQLHPLKEVGRRFRAPAGSAWTSELELFRYTRPLAAGRYRFSLTYRYGEESAATNETEVEIAPARLLANRFRWFGESAARGQLASVWTTLDGETTRWFFQTVSAKDPGVVVRAADLEMGNVSRELKPSIAHLNDIASFHFERYVMWVDGERLGWIQAADTGRISEPAFIEHELGEGAVLADPPLQKVAGGFAAVVAGRGSYALIDVDDKGSASKRIVPGEAAAVAWTESEEAETFALSADRGALLRANLGGEVALPGEAAALAIDQWMGRGKAFAVARDESVFEVIGWDLADPALEPERLSSYDAEALPRGFITGELLDTAPLAEAQDLAMLFPGERAWAVLSQRKQYRAPRSADADGPAYLVAARGGLFVVEHFPESGFIAVRLGEAPPPDAI